MMERGEAVIHIINKFKVKRLNQSFRCILIYLDVATGYCIIRPLMNKVALEIVMELFKIFTTYGPPSELHVNSCSWEMVDYMEVHMKIFCPMFDVKFIKKNVSSNNIVMQVVTKLHRWMEETKREEWEIGCLVVQRQQNMLYSDVIKSTPQELFFKHGRGRTEGVIDKPDRAENVYQQQNTSVNREQNTPKDDISSGLFKIKQEIENYEETTSMKERMVLFDGGLIFPGLKKSHAHVEVKMERLDEW